MLIRSCVSGEFQCFTLLCEVSGVPFYGLDALIPNSNRLREYEVVRGPVCIQCSFIGT